MTEVSGATADRGWIQLGTVSTTGRAAVDGRGLVTAGAARWSLDWWIGADDRWHTPGREVSVRQRRIDDVPVVETAMKVPGGDAVHRAYAAQSAAGPAVVVEVENRTSVPFAVALAIVPVVVGGTGNEGMVRQVTWHELTVEVDGAVAVQLPRAPARVAGGSADRTLRAVVDGHAVPPSSARLAEGSGDTSAALVYPLAHRATLRVVLPIEPTTQPAPSSVTTSATSSATPSAMPGANDVVRGWRTQLDRGPTLVVPDDRYRRALDAGRCDLLLFHAGEAVSTWPHEPVATTVAASVAEALDRYGYHLEAEEVVRGIAGRQRLDGGIRSVRGELGANGAVLWALGRHWQLTRDGALVDDLIGPMAKAGHWIDKRRRSRRRPLRRDASADDLAWSVRGLEAIDGALDAIGQPEVAEDFRRFAAQLRAEGATTADEDPSNDVVTAALDGVSGGHPPDPRATADCVRVLRNLLVREEADGLVLAAMVPHSWLGQSWEVQGLPTRFGSLGYAVRWHGDRPALLWELEPFADTGPVVLHATGLDPAWSTSASSGEALLGAVPPPGDRPGVAGDAGASSSFT